MVHNTGLIFRGKRLQYERANDYFSRIALCNGFSDDQSFKRFLREACPAPELDERYRTLQSDPSCSISLRRLAAVLSRPLRLMNYDANRPEFHIRKKRICPGCYSLNQVVYFFWYFPEIDYCHLCGTELRPVFPDLVTPKCKSGASAHIKEWLWFSLVLEQAAVRKFPLAYIRSEIENMRDCIWLCLIMKRYCLKYGGDYHFCSQGFKSLVRSREFWALSEDEKFDTLIRCISQGDSDNGWRLNYIAARSILAPGDRGGRQYDSSNRIYHWFSRPAILWADKILAEIKVVENST